MIRSPEELTNAIKSAVNRRAVLFSHLLLAVVISAHTLLDSTSTHFEVIFSVALSISIIILIFFRFFDLIRINNRPPLFFTAYLLIGIIGIGFLSEASTPYMPVFFIIVFLGNLYYGSKGVYITVGAFGIATLIKYFYLSSTIGLTTSAALNVFVAFFVFFAACSFYINIQSVFDWDRARLRDTIKESAVEQKRMRALINNMTESVLVLDKEGIIRLYNAAALALFNTNNSLSDKPLDGFVKLEDEKGHIITTHDIMPRDTKPVFRNDIMLRYGTEDTAALSLVVTPIRSTFGEEKDEAGYVMTLRDITHEKSLEEERDEFISVISHELRTPVTVAEAGVSNAILLIDKLDGNEKIKDSLKTAHDQSVYLANMLNDLSTFARAEKGTLELNLEEFDPRELLEHLSRDYRTAVEAKGMAIATMEDPSTPIKMASNRLYLREILQNFITNAIKYSDKGTITLSARAKDKGVLFSVSDQGIGISTSDQKKIFEKFFRAEDYRTRSTNGTGLGLYITKKLAKILDATFEVTSEVGVGSVFSVYLPDKSDILAVKHKSAVQPKTHSTHHEPSAHHTPAPVIRTIAASQAAAHLPKAPPATPPAIPAQHTVASTSASSSPTTLSTTAPPESTLPKQG